MAATTIISVVLLCVLGSAFANTTPKGSSTTPKASNMIKDVLSPAQKHKVCTTFNTTADLCPNAGMNDPLCVNISACVNGTNPKCVQLGVCSFVVIPSNITGSTTTAKPHSTTTPTTTPKPVSTTHHSTTPAPPPVIPEVNTVYVTDFEPDELPSNFVLLEACSNDADYSFIYPCATAGIKTTKKP